MDKNLESYIAERNAGKETFVQMLFRIIDEKKLSDTEVYKRAGLDRKYFSKMRCNDDYKPKKKVVCALVLALELDNATSKRLIKKAGYILTSASKFDLTIRYCIENGIYDLVKVNELLYDAGLEVL